MHSFVRDLLHPYAFANACNDVAVFDWDELATFGNPPHSSNFVNSNSEDDASCRCDEDFVFRSDDLDGDQVSSLFVNPH